MKFMMAMIEREEEFVRREDPETAPAYWAAWQAYSKAMSDAGIVQSGAALLPPETATSVRLRDGRREVQDGPFADSKEQLGGYFLVEVASLDEALEWAAKAPCAATGGVEIRPLLPPRP